METTNNKCHWDSNTAAPEEIQVPRSPALCQSHVFQMRKIHISFDSLCLCLFLQFTGSCSFYNTGHLPAGTRVELVGVTRMLLKPYLP